MSEFEDNLREAGWLEVDSKECVVGDLVLDPMTHTYGVVEKVVGGTLELDHPRVISRSGILRAPRPEPVYEVGEVWWATTECCGDQALIRQAGPEEECPWAAPVRDRYIEVFASNEVTAHHKMLNADGTMATPEITEEMVERAAYAQARYSVLKWEDAPVEFKRMWRKRGRAILEAAFGSEG